MLKPYFCSDSEQIRACVFRCSAPVHDRADRMITDFHLSRARAASPTGIARLSVPSRMRGLHARTLVTMIVLLTGSRREPRRSATATMAVPRRTCTGPRRTRAAQQYLERPGLRCKLPCLTVSVQATNQIVALPLGWDSSDAPKVCRDAHPRSSYCLPHHPPTDRVDLTMLIPRKRRASCATLR